MPAPFCYPAIKGTTAGTPGTGAFTPNAAAAKSRAWSTVPAGWIGLVMYEDGNAAEWTWSYWNGTTLSRAASQMFDSTSGSQLSLTSAATAAMVADPFEVMSDLGGTQWFGAKAQSGSTNTTVFGQSSGPTVTGTNSSTTPANTNLLTEQIAQISTSATTASAQAAWVMGGNAACIQASTTAGRGGFMAIHRWGATQLPTGPRMFVGVAAPSFVGATEPSNINGQVIGFSKDSTDTNIQFLTNLSGSGTKIDTGIPWVANGLYEATVWMEPGGGRAHGLLIRLDTGAIFYTSTATDIPTTSQVLQLQCVGGLNATNTGTAIIMRWISSFARGGC